MRRRNFGFWAVICSLLTCSCCLKCFGQVVDSDVPYVANGHARHVLDVYSPAESDLVGSPIVIWIHGGGWVVGDKSAVDRKPKVLTDKGYLFVAMNYRLLPEVSMEELLSDVAKAVGWTARNAEKYGGDPNRLVLAGHSAGAQVAALLCTDESYLAKEGVSLDSIRGCVPVDGDTYDIPKIIMSAEHRQAIYGWDMPNFGHRQKFGNDPQKHVNFSAVTHVSRGKGIPPFLILYFRGNPETYAQAKRLSEVLDEAGIKHEVVGKADTNHRQLNRELGKDDDVPTEKFLSFLEEVFGSGKAD
jgi:arylformamidase